MSSQQEPTNDTGNPKDLRDCSPKDSTDETEEADGDQEPIQSVHLVQPGTKNNPVSANAGYRMLDAGQNPHSAHCLTIRQPAFGI